MSCVLWNHWKWQIYCAWFLYFGYFYECAALFCRIYIVHDEVKDKNFELELSWVGESKYMYLICCLNFDQSIYMNVILNDRTDTWTQIHAITWESLSKLYLRLTWLICHFCTILSTQEINIFCSWIAHAKILIRLLPVHAINLWFITLWKKKQ